MSKIILDLNIDDDLKISIERKIKNKKLLIEEYILELIKADIDSVIYFNDYSFNFYLDKLFYENKEIELTNIQKKLFKLLLNNANNLVSIEDIHSIVWKNKKMSIHTLRNMINNLRKKTYFTLIGNISNHGYKIVI